MDSSIDYKDIIDKMIESQDKQAQKYLKDIKNG